MTPHHHSHTPHDTESVYARFLRPLLPKKTCNLSGVTTRGPFRMFEDPEDPTYKQCLCDAIREYVSTGDAVNIVGESRGVPTVLAAEAGGDVTVYEASVPRYDQIQQTLGLNGCVEAVEVVHAVVGAYGDTSREEHGAEGHVTKLRPQAVSDCDILVLDCDGAEYDILASMSQPPETIIVEYHGYLQSPESRMKTLLEERGYDIVGSCKSVNYETHGVGVLVAQR